MDKLTAPSFVVDGKTYTATTPKVKAWHDFVAFDNDVAKIPAEDVLEKMCHVMSGLFKVEPDFLIENLPLTDVKPLYRRCFTWIVALVNANMDNLPKNVEKGA